MTSKGQSGGPLLINSKPPFEALSASTIGSVTKRLLNKFGISTAVWAPHSTRGAGVFFWKKMGLSSEEVCEIGKWKNVQAFSAHYLRLGAVDRAAQLMGRLVHKISPGDCAEPELSRTPGNFSDPGGREKEGEARHW